MKDREFMPGEELEGGDDADTAEYETRRSRVYRGQAAARGGRGYWIGPEESDRGTGEAGSGARLLSQRSAAQPRPRHGRRMLLWMGLSLVVLVALVIVAVLVLAGEMVVPGLSAKLFPIHYQAEIARVADDYGQDPYLVAAMVKTESGYDPTAESGAGAVGLMQLMPPSGSRPGCTSGRTAPVRCLLIPWTAWISGLGISIILVICTATARWPLWLPTTGGWVMWMTG
jgi:hypothetical protein